MNLYLIVILGLLIGFRLLDMVVHALNLRAASPEIPEAFRGVYEEEAYAKSQRYLRESTRVEMVTGGIQTLALAGFIVLGGFAWVQEIAAGLSASPIPQALVFGGLLMLISSVFGLPFSVYDTFVLEQKYGFNKTTPKTFVLDFVKGLMLTALIGGPLFAALVWFFRSAGGNAWWISWAVVSALQLFLLYIAPVVILPLFNKFTPLAEGGLRKRLEAYAAGQGFHLTGLYTIDGSRRSTRANAYFTGFGRNRRIALYDTLIEKHGEEELEAVLAHEVGHAKCGHIPKQLAVGLLSTGLLFFLLGFFIRAPGLYAAFGIGGGEELPVHAGLVFFGFLYSPVSALLAVLTHALSRRFEFEADAFAARTTGGPEALITALRKLSVDNLSNLTPHPALVVLEYSHPPVLRRILALRREAGSFRPRK